MVNINNPALYKATRKKKYQVYVCLPPIGTKVHNHLEKADYVTDTNKRFVLSGTVGEQWVIDAVKLAKTYTFMDGTPITQETVVKRCKVTNGQPILDWTPLQTLPNGVINWALFVPVKQKLQIQTAWGSVLQVNAPGVPHGQGDFIVCADMNGQPNLADRWVVNGAIFPTTYDMRAFSSLQLPVVMQEPIPKPAPLK